MAAPIFGGIQMNSTLPRYGSVQIGGPPQPSFFDQKPYVSPPLPPLPQMPPPRVVQQPAPQAPQAAAKHYVSPNPIADFFCAPSHSTPWPHNGGYRG